MEKVQYRNYYRVTDNGVFAEITFFVTNNFGETLVAQQEGLFDSLEDARYMIEHLESIGADIEFMETASYTG